MRRLLLALAATLSLTASTGTASSSNLLHFKSPSGNINCFLDAGQGGGAADCIVRQASWPSTPQKPASCNLDWAPNEVQLTRTEVTIGGCRGDVGPLCYTGNGRCSTLAYGHRLTAGTIRCSSSPSGITCRRTTGTRHGFRVAREGVKVY